MNHEAANAFKAGVIGDSLSTATNANDECHNAWECIGNLGEDPDYSFVDGTQGWSLYNRAIALGMELTGSVSAARGNARWQDALTQTQALLADPEVQVVHIELGSNDVCADPLPVIEEIETHIDVTFGLLTDSLSEGTIFISEVPDVVRVREVMKDRPHFLFNTFQDLWDLNTDRLNSTGVIEICEGLYGSQACQNDEFIELTEAFIRTSFTDIFEAVWGDQFPCPKVLSSESTDFDRQAARSLNQQINSLLAAKIRQYHGRNNTHFLFANNVYEWKGDAIYASQLDGFHLNRLGQQRLALQIWNGAVVQVKGTHFIGLYNPATGTFQLRNGFSSGPADLTFRFGPTGAGWVPLVGDWDGDGFATVGLYDPAASRFYLRNAQAGGPADLTFRFGPAGSSWVPLVGDWNGNGFATVGLYDPATSRFYLRNTQAGGPADLTFRFGPAGSSWVPLVGDWDGDGFATVGLYDPATSRFYLRNAQAGGPADLTFRFGPAGSSWVPLVGDWNGDGFATVGLYDPATSRFYLRNAQSGGPADLTFRYGPAQAGWSPLVGDWDSNGIATIGLYNRMTGAFHLREEFAAGWANIVLIFGPPNADWVPLIGD